MNVEFVSVTSTDKRDEHGRQLTAEDLIVYTARVSNPSNQLNLATAPKLLAYCIRNRHWSVFDLADLCVEIKTSRAIAAQILRHHSFRFQEFSQRYAMAFGSEPIELRRPGATNRQSSEEPLNNPLLDVLVEEHVMDGFELYGRLVAEGASKETARFVLPLSTQTTLYMKGSVRSWVHYLMVRDDPHAQKEHRVVAQAVRPIMQKHFPNVMAAVDSIRCARSLAPQLAALALAAKNERSLGSVSQEAQNALTAFVLENVDDLVLAMES